MSISSSFQATTNPTTSFNSELSRMTRTFVPLRRNAFSSSSLAKAVPPFPHLSLRCDGRFDPAAKPPNKKRCSRCTFFAPLRPAARRQPTCSFWSFVSYQQSSTLPDITRFSIYCTCCSVNSDFQSHSSSLHRLTRVRSSDHATYRLYQKN